MFFGKISFCGWEAVIDDAHGLALSIYWVEIKLAL
jgi:hypothetical protein